MRIPLHQTVTKVRTTKFFIPFQKPNFGSPKARVLEALSNETVQINAIRCLSFFHFVLLTITFLVV